MNDKPTDPALLAVYGEGYNDGYRDCELAEQRPDLLEQLQTLVDIRDKAYAEGYEHAAHGLPRAEGYSRWPTSPNDPAIVNARRFCDENPGQCFVKLGVTK